MKKKIIDKAGEMFLNLGFKSTTMDDIANELGVSKKTLYKHFPNKSSLVDASTESVHKSIVEMIDKIKSKNFNAVEEEFAVKAIFKEVLKNTKTSPMYQLKKYYPETYMKVKERELCMFKDCISSNILKGVEQGLYRADINQESMVNFYFTLVFGVFENDFYGDGVQELMKVEYEILEYHIRAMATEKGIAELEKQLQTTNQI